MKESKPFAISKEIVWKAYKSVKANKGAAGIDGESIAEFEKDLKGNLYKLWNRMSSGSYFPPAVRAVEIPKPRGRGARILGVPTVADRIAQTVVKMYLEPEVEPVFHEDSYGYRPKRSALQAVGKCRERCWKNDWVIDLDIRAFFDTLDHELVMRAVRQHTDLTWIHLYVERWLKAPLQRVGGEQIGGESGSPQGSVISPLLANLYLHYAFDVWMAREFPAIGFERYCDDVVVHCGSRGQAEDILRRITERLAECRLEVSESKTHIVYCKDRRRSCSHEYERFDYLGFTFQARMCKGGKNGEYFAGFNPAVSHEACREIGQKIREWRLHLRSGESLSDLAEAVNSTVRGWINYYGRYFPSRLHSVLRRLDQYLVRWARRKYKRLKRHPKRAWAFLARVIKREPGLFAHWGMNRSPWLGNGSRMNREVHVRF